MLNSFFIQQSGLSGWNQIGNSGELAKLFLAESGNFLGLNTNRPQSTFHMVQRSGDGAVFTLQSTGDDQNQDSKNFNAYIAFDDVSGNVGQIGFNQSGYNYLKIQNYATGDPYIILSNSQQPEVSIDKHGNLGLNTLFPTGKLHVVQSGAGIGSEGPNNNIAVMQMTGTDSSENPEFVLKSDGKLGLNNYSPRYTLDVSGHNSAVSGYSTIKSDSYIYGYDERYYSGLDMGRVDSPSIVVDFDGRSFRSLTLTGSLPHYFTTTNGTTLGQNEMKSVSVKLWASGEAAEMVFDNDISFLGYTPTGLARDAVGILSFNSFGPTVKDTVAVFRQPGDIQAGPPGAEGQGKHGEPGEEFRNKIIGGDFGANPWQRLVDGKTGFYAVHNGQYTADRFCYTSSGYAMPLWPLETGANTIFLLTSERATHLNQTFTDKSDSSYSIGVSGTIDPHHSTESYKWEDSSIRFSGTSGCLYVPGLKDFKPSTCDATIEFWYKFNDYASTIEEGAGIDYIEDDAVLTYGRFNQTSLGLGWGFAVRQPGLDQYGNQQNHGYMYFDLSAGGGGYKSVGGKTVGMTTYGDPVNVTDGNWHHIAVTHELSSHRWNMFADGQLQDSVFQENLEYDDDDYDLLLGAGMVYTTAGSVTTTGHFANCNLDYVRITSGEVLYKAAAYNVYRDSDHPDYEDFYYGLGDGPSYATTGSLAIECVGANSGVHTGETYITGSGFSGYCPSYSMLEHKIEGYHARDLLTNDCTLSFWAKALNVSGLFPVSLRNHDNTISYVTTYDLCHPNEWKKFDLMIPTITGSGGEPILESSFNLNEGIGLSIGWTLDASSGVNVPTGIGFYPSSVTKNTWGQDITGTSGQWITGHYIGFSGNTSGASMAEVAGSMLKIAGPEIKYGWRTGPELSKVRSQQQELELCKRYFERLDFEHGMTVGVGQCIGTGDAPTATPGGFSLVPTETFPAGGTDPHWSNVQLLIQSETTDGSTTFTDSSSFGKTVNTSNVLHKTTLAKWGNSSIFWDGTAGHLESPADIGFFFGTDDFTIETWFYITSYHNNFACSNCGGRGRDESWQGLLSTSASPEYKGWFLGYNNYGAMMYSASYAGTNNRHSIMTADNSVKLNQWHFVAVSRENGITRIYLDGVSIGETAIPVDFAHGGVSSTLNFRAGEVYNTHTNYMHKGYMEDIRITKGVARYSPSVNKFTSSVNSMLTSLTQPTELFRGVPLHFQEKRSIPKITYHHKDLTVTDMNFEKLNLRELEFNSITKNQSEISGYVDNRDSVHADGEIGSAGITKKWLMPGHATTLYTSGDNHFFIDAEL